MESVGFILHFLNDGHENAELQNLNSAVEATADEKGRWITNIIVSAYLSIQATFLKLVRTPPISRM